MSMKETIIESLGLVEIKKGETVRKGQTFYSIDSFEGTGRVIVDEHTASKDFVVRLDGFYRESFNIDDLNPGSVVKSSGELYFVVDILGEKCFADTTNYIYIYSEVEIDEVIYYA